VRGNDTDAKGWLIMRRSRQVLVAACGMALAAATSVPVFAQTHGGAAAARTLPVKKIQANNFRFCKPSETTCSTTADTNHKTHVLVGQKIKWIYRDTACDSYYICPGHNVTFKSKHSATVMQEGAVIYTTTFHNPGTYKYWCTHHQNQGMTGRIVVTTS
jgi:plastocyanin